MPPVFHLPRPIASYILYTDACDRQVGFILLQQQSDKLDKLVVYWSKSLKDAEHAYHTKHKACLAVVLNVLLLIPYLKGAVFKVRSDHDALPWILNLADGSGKLAR